MDNTAKIAIITFILLIVGAVLVTNFKKQEIDKRVANIKGEAYPILNATHLAPGTTFGKYNSNPPSSGPHYPSALPWGVYEKEMPDEAVLHSLEHGGIWIAYKDLGKEDVESLKKLAQKYNMAVILTPRSKNDSSLALVSWGRLLRSDKVDIAQVEDFIKSNVNNSPERLAVLPEAD